MDCKLSVKKGMIWVLGGERTLKGCEVGALTSKGAPIRTKRRSLFIFHRCFSSVLDNGVPF